ANQGTDTVQTAFASYTLGANVENVTYTGGATFAGIGNTPANSITGGAGRDTPEGGAGPRTPVGGLGNRTHSAATGGGTTTGSGAVVSGSAGAGADVVQTTAASYTIGANIENLVYLGAGTFAGTGSASANSITGGAGNDTLDGGAGNDTLVGGLGNDTYVVDS